MKFRCERDTLADAVATAQRTVASRSGALPVLQDLRITATADGLELIGSDLEITNRVQVPAEVEETGVAVVPKLLGEIVRQARARAGHGRGHRRRGGDQRGPVLDVVAPEAGRGLPAARVERRPGRASSTPRRSRLALRQVVRAASKDDLRPILTGVLLTAHGGGSAARGDRLVPARGTRPEGREHARRGPAGARSRPRACPRCSGSPATARSRSCCASATWCSARRAPRSRRG